MPTVTYSLRMDEGLKRSFDSFCSSVGLSSTAAINLFAKKAVIEQRIPFEISATKDRRIAPEEALAAFTQLRQEAAQNGLQNLTPTDIATEIRTARESQ